MKWGYRRYRIEPSQLCAQGEISRPEAKVRLGGLKGNAYLRALVDTGADHCVFPFSLASEIGAELFNDEEDAAKGFSGHEISIVPGKVELELLAEDASYTWVAVVGFARFASSDDECNILGHVGCLEFFLSAFDGKSQFFELQLQQGTHEFTS